tara:strand:+ start:5040 stop:5297 length:258 start_codon:yes stop_codon:yes gene_type:complete
MSKDTQAQAYLEQLRHEPIRMCNWPLLRLLAFFIALVLSAGMLADDVFEMRKLAITLYGAGGVACCVLCMFAFDRRLYVVKQPKS